MNQSHWWNRVRYRAYAPVYDWIAKPMERGRARAVERLDLRAGDEVLVLGCGTGSDLPYIPDGVAVTAVDITPAMVRRTEARARRLDREVDARVGDAQALPFEDDRFDAVLLHLVLSVVPDPDAVAAETARVLAPEGRVSIYDKFVPEGTEASLARRALNPIIRTLFSDITRQLGAILDGTGLDAGARESFLGGLYTVTVAAPDEPKRADAQGRTAASP